MESSEVHELYTTWFKDIKNMGLDWVDEVVDLLGRYEDDEVINTR